MDTDPENIMTSFVFKPSDSDLDCSPFSSVESINVIDNSLSEGRKSGVGICSSAEVLRSRAATPGSTSIKSNNGGDVNVLSSSTISVSDVSIPCQGPCSHTSVSHSSSFKAPQESCSNLEQPQRVLSPERNNISSPEMRIGGSSNESLATTLASIYDSEESEKDLEAPSTVSSDSSSYTGNCSTVGSDFSECCTDSIAIGPESNEGSISERSSSLCDYDEAEQSPNIGYNPRPISAFRKSSCNVTSPLVINDNIAPKLLKMEVSYSGSREDVQITQVDIGSVEDVGLGLDCNTVIQDSPGSIPIQEQGLEMHDTDREYIDMIELESQAQDIPFLHQDEETFLEPHIIVVESDENATEEAGNGIVIPVPDLNILTPLPPDFAVKEIYDYELDEEHSDKQTNQTEDPPLSDKFVQQLLAVRPKSDDGSRDGRRRVSFAPSYHRQKKSICPNPQSNDKHLDKTPSASRRKSSESSRDSIPVVPSSSRPDWYQDLNGKQVNMFREVFELLDRDGGGSLDAQELYTVMKELDIEVSLDEIESVLQELDKDGNGEIDFDEFLYTMSETDRYLEMLSSDPEKAAQEHERRGSGQSHYNPRQTLFFTAITSFAIKNSLGEVERYYASKVRHAPHVISCYTAGARLIGLNDKQLERQLRKMQKAAKNEKSPYAKPLPFVTVDKKKHKKNTSGTKSVSTGGRKKTAVEPQQKPAGPDIEEVMDTKSSIHSEPDTTKHPAAHQTDGRSFIDMTCDVDPKEAENRQKMESTARRTAVTPDSINEDLLKTLRQLAEKGSVVARIPDIHLVPQIRNKLESGDVTDPLCSSLRKRRRTLNKETEIKDNNKKTDHKLSKKTHGWGIPRVSRLQAPLPVIKVAPRNGKPFTIEDVSDIRKRVSGALDNYYEALRLSLVQPALEHWNQLHIKEISSHKMTDRFRTVFRSYSPHKVEEVFPICPWIPAPGYTSKQPRSNGTVAQVSIPRSPCCQSLMKGNYVMRHVRSAGRGTREGQTKPAHTRNISSARAFTTRPKSVTRGGIRQCGFSHKVRSTPSPQPRAISAKTRTVTISSSVPRPPSRYGNMS